MKQSGNQHGEIHVPQPGGDGEGPRSNASDDLIIVPLPDDFDIDTLFRSEQELAEATMSAPAGEARAIAPAPAADPVRVNPEPRALLDPESAAPDRAKAPSLSIADLIDNHVRLEWYEAVAIGQHLCNVMARDPAASLHTSLVEPWNVEITNSGEVQVLPGGSSSDPLVKQVGRVLRVLLQDSIAPPELRLVAAQASFDVPVYSSVDELSAALRHFERSGEVEAIRAAFNRGLDAKFSVSPTHVRVAPVAGPLAPQVVEQSGTPKSVPAAVSVISRPRSRSSSLQVFAAVAAAVIAVILIATALLMFRRTPTTEERPVASTPEPQGRQIEAQPSAPPASASTASAPTASAPQASTLPASTPPPSAPPEIAPQQRPEVVAAPRPLSVPRPKPRPVTNTVTPAVSPRVLRPLAGPRTVSPLATPSPRYIAPTVRPTATSDSLEADERQAAGLLASGRADEAAMFFDAIVMRNPLYHLDPARTSPEALLAFRNSKRVLLPALARRHYQDAQAAFETGDFSLAISEGERALALLNDVDIEAGPADLKADVPDLLARASASRTVEEERIYALGDPGVTPPRPLGRQLSTASQSRTLFRPTGRLEILVGRTGRVEAVKLDTPLNGYHDRMLVSAAKAWHYRPALRNGKPVRFTLVMSINLPDL